ncbi:MAG: YfcE family phosphodiesterase [Ignavibacteria bacterium]|nr:YfcE family phosphodiesterase [Ignavibacteria bacterium]
MRILAFTDIHGAYSKVIEILSREAPFDAIIIGGDLTTHGTPDEAEQAVKGFNRFDKPLLVVAGNMDPPPVEERLGRLGVDINAKGRLLDNVGFFGISGSPVTPMHTPYEISEEEIKKRANAGWRDVEPAAWKIFVPHAPPRDTKLDKIFLGKHVGSSAVREFVEQHQPDVVVCGHIHEARGIDSIGKTQMVNCGPAGRGHYAVIEVGEGINVTLRG